MGSVPSALNHLLLLAFLSRLQMLNKKAVPLVLTLSLYPFIIQSKAAMLLPEMFLSRVHVVGCSSSEGRNVKGLEKSI